MLTGCDYQIAKINTPTTQCGMCSATILSALNQVDGIKDVVINESGKSVSVKYFEEKVSVEQLESTISKVGYQANDLQADPKAYSKLHFCCKLPKDRK